MKTNKQTAAELLTIVAMICIIIAFSSAIFAQNYVVFSAGLVATFISITVGTIINPSHK